ncbi:MAG: VCBS repeat-containing protein [Planctomycetes bacterium]|nr:VCBS repeat-containing protein [Planctomycetota bacterium]
MPFNAHSLSATALLAMMSGIASAQMTVNAISPSQNANNVLRSAAVAVTFDRPVDTTTFTTANFHLLGKVSGPVAGSFSFSNGNRTVTFTPSKFLAAGEQVLVTMSRNLRGSDGVALRSAGYSAHFTTRVAASTGTFTHLVTMSNVDGTGNQTRIYGTNACDLNRDGWADLTTVNEVSRDLRVFLNRADGTGLYQPMLTPYTLIPNESSPNSIADFDGDGLTDIVTSSAMDSKIAIAFGRGDGTFRSVLQINTGIYPRDFGIFDADGDGDIDITVAQANTNNVLFVRNNGGGVFAAPVAFEGGVNGEYGMNGADMNNDGIMDLVVAGVNSETISVLRGNGDGTFTLSSTRPVGGRNWVVLCGDLNNDGRMDVCTANSFSSNGSILLGNGNLTLQPATTYAIGGHCVATDLADLEGDGDLDWILSSFGAGRWYVFKNNGSGIMTPDVQFVAPNNPSCTAPVDVDNDGDMDLVLSDEIADVIIIQKNVGGCTVDVNVDHVVDFFDYLDFVAAFSANSPIADFNHDGTIDFFDYLDFVATFSQGCA